MLVGETSQGRGSGEQENGSESTLFGQVGTCTGPIGLDIFNPFIVIDGNHINGIIDLTEKGIGVRQSFLKWALRALCIDHNTNEQKKI